LNSIQLSSRLKNRGSTDAPSIPLAFFAEVLAFEAVFGFAAVFVAAARARLAGAGLAAAALPDVLLVLSCFF
jgi:hypothetical protein